MTEDIQKFMEQVHDTLELMIKDGLVGRKYEDGEYKYWFTPKGNEVAKRFQEQGLI